MEVLNLVDLGTLFVSFIPVGFLLGCIPMAAGIVVDGVFKIIKKV